MSTAGLAATAVALGEPAHRCPICRATEFIPFNGREMARCAQCKSVERNRLLWMIMQKRGVFRPGMRVLHMAPEQGLARRLVELCGDRYHACDLDPDRYRSRFMTVRALDLCTDLQKLPSRAFDLILHSHVMEHLPCSVESVLGELERVLAPGGHHFLSVPISGAHTREDLDESLTPEERRHRFGQEDHMRIFGSVDLVAMLRRVWGVEDPLIEPLSLLTPDELRLAAIPEAAWRGPGSHSVFHHQRPLRRPVRIAPNPVRPEPLPDPSPRKPKHGGPRLLLLMGMPRTGIPRLDRWLRPAAEALAQQGVHHWPQGQDVMEVIFGGFGTPERRAKGEAWLRRAEARPGGAPTPKAARATLDAWIESLGEGTGLLAADGLWSLQAPEVAALANHLAARRVRSTVLCWLRPPAEQIATMLEDRLLRGLSLQELGPGIERAFQPSYKRLDAWLTGFGKEAVTVRLAPEEPLEACRAMLSSFGISVPDMPVRPPPPAEPPPSLPAARALLALREGPGIGQATEALRARLRQVPGEPLVFPELVWRLLEPVLAREIGYLADRFGLSPESLRGDVTAMDDAAFLGWDAAAIRALLLAVDAEQPG
ncbi:Methyltransferase domain-containing protein [Roseomonas rosea]|uniref:Methyltransferase domain-containing protein n=1 Tax=Muricoccus roseus TaxID=198092 RepID=A0A1M6B5G3_9PROT|nr:methyltransferase domain-containing protein [Roseomonas rosea]SHI43982.1 Methyltransferase domain-containing protein [Roseomonas rosea]